MCAHLDLHDCPYIPHHSRSKLHCTSRDTLQLHLLPRLKLLPPKGKENLVLLPAGYGP